MKYLAVQRSRAEKSPETAASGDLRGTMLTK